MEVTKSQYHASFMRLAAELDVARQTAASNCVYLSTLRKHFLVLESDSATLAEVLDATIRATHTLALVWKHAPHYTETPRLVLLFHKIGNALVTQVRCWRAVLHPALLTGRSHATNHTPTQARRFMSHESILRTKPIEGLALINDAVTLLTTFKSAFFAAKSRLNSSKPDRAWRMQTSALFPRVDAMLDRCNDLAYVLQAVLSFSTLDGIEIGGVKVRSSSFV